MGGAVLTVVGIPTAPVALREFVANGLMRDLEQHAPEVAAARRAQLEALGVRWLTPVEAPEPPDTDLVTVAEAALQLRVPPTRISQWRAREQIRDTGQRGRVFLSDCRAMVAKVDGGAGLRVA